MLPTELIRKTKKFSDRILNNQDSIQKDLSLVLRHAWTIPFLFSPYNAESSTKSELNWQNYNTLGDVLNVALQAVIPRSRNRPLVS